MPDSDVIVIEILGTRLQLRGGDDPEKVQQIAEYVKQKVEEMSEMAASAGAKIPPLQLSLLAAINIAEDLFNVHQQGSGDHEILEIALEKANQVLEKAVVKS